VPGPVKIEWKVDRWRQLLIRLHPAQSGSTESTMIYAINLALLISAVAGAWAAFAGETWRAAGEPLYMLHRRVTRRGWIALGCLLAALAFGIIKEVHANGDSAETARRRQELETALATAAAGLQEARTNLAAAEANLTRTMADLQNTRARLAAVEPSVVEAMAAATSGARRESDYSTTEVTQQAEIPLLSGRTGKALVLYGGDQIDYYVFCNEGRRSESSGQSQHRSGLVLKAGESAYPLQGSGKQTLTLAGPAGQTMPAVLKNPNGARGCLVKILIEAADRTRETQQLEPLLRMIKEAKAEQAEKEAKAEPAKAEPAKTESAKATDGKAEDPR
jgi:hypothetical protein